MPSGPGNPLIPVKSVHLGKEWGYGPSPVPGMEHTYYPFSDSSLLTAAYAGRETALASFNAKRLELDPEGLFAGGGNDALVGSNEPPLSPTSSRDPLMGNPVPMSMSSTRTPPV